MPDLIGAFERVRRVYRWYIESAFPLRSDALSREREFLLDRIGSGDVPGTLAQPPLVEPVTVYERSPHNLREASLQLPKEYQDVQYLAEALFPPEVKLYKHQFDALKLGIQGEDVVVTTGTGSGKTESFLLPLLAYLARATLVRGRAAPFLTTRTNATRGPRRAGGGRKTRGVANKTEWASGSTTPNGPTRCAGSSSTRSTPSWKTSSDA